jgi:fatty aldehyde-generating acyl-ACP reductase
MARTRSQNWFRLLYQTLILFLAAMRDLFLLWSPRFVARLLVRKGEFAFLIHPRDLSDVARKYPVMDRLPLGWIENFTRFFWPIIGSQIIGLNSITTGEEKIGYIVVCPLTPEQMHYDKRLAKKRILQTTRLAEKLGCRLIGLGALSTSMSNAGEYLIDKVNIGITTGYAYTIAIILQMLDEVVDTFGMELQSKTLAIVGAAGYMGVPSSRIISEQKKIGKILLVDRPAKRPMLELLRKEIQTATTEVSTTLQSLRQADIVIVVTNSVEVLIKPEHLKPGAVVLDDSQPRNTSKDLVWTRPDVLILDVIANAPGINCNFPFGFPHSDDVFTCCGEVLLLSAHEWKDHFAVGHFDEQLVHQIMKWSQSMKFKVAQLRSFNELVPKEKLEYIKTFHQPVAESLPQ